jgi:hypothetical protein
VSEVRRAVERQKSKRWTFAGPGSLVGAPTLLAKHEPVERMQRIYSWGLYALLLSQRERG